MDLEWQIYRPDSVVADVIRLMSKLLTLLLIALCGCSVSPSDDAKRESQGTDTSRAANGRRVVSSIYGVPRPKSGIYSTEVATSLLPESVSNPLNNNEAQTSGAQAKFRRVISRQRSLNLRRFFSQPAGEEVTAPVGSNCSIVVVVDVIVWVRRGWI